MTVYIF